MAVAAVQELEPQVDAVETEVSQETVPSTGEGTETNRQPAKAKVNLDEFEEFRNYKSVRDKETAQIRKQQEALALQLQQITQQTREQKLANMDDYERERFEKEEARQEAAYYRTQYEQTLIQQQRSQALAQIAQKYKVPLEAIEAAEDPAEARDLAWEWREKQIEQESSKSAEAQAAKAAKREANKVDIGTGIPPTNTSEWEREYQRLEKARDFKGLLKHSLSQG
jgi:hypothetical protein